MIGNDAHLVVRVGDIEQAAHGVRNEHLAVHAHGYAARLALAAGQAVAAARHLDTADRLDVGDPAVVSWLSDIAEKVRGPRDDEAAHTSGARPEGRASARPQAPPAVTWFAGRVPALEPATIARPGAATRRAS